MKLHARLPVWSIIFPGVAWAIFILNLTGLGTDLGGLMDVLLALGLIAGILAAVFHAEVVAHRVGEPYGTLVLALAVTGIEVALIVSLMIAGGEAASGLARDTVFASVMTGWTLSLGIDAKSTVLLVLSLFVASLSLGTGRTTVMQGTVHLVIFAVYLFTAIVP